jgi:hypothetical protein
LAVDYRKYKKNIQAEPKISSNPKREEIVVKSVKALLNGQMSPQKFVEKLKEQDMPVENVRNGFLEVIVNRLLKSLETLNHLINKTLIDLEQNSLENLGNL